MSFGEIVAIAVGLAMDAFAVAIASSITLRQASGRQIFRLAFHFGLFQFMMPIIGWLAGQTIERWIISWDHWLAFGLLAFVGGKAIFSALMGSKAETNRDDPTRGVSLVVLSVATSIDALAVGLTFSMLQVKIFYPCVVIGLVAAAATVLGMRIGARLGDRFGRRMEIVGGLVLITIGVKIIAEHLGL